MASGAPEWNAGDGGLREEWLIKRLVLLYWVCPSLEDEVHAEDLNAGIEQQQSGFAVAAEDAVHLFCGI